MDDEPGLTRRALLRAGGGLGAAAGLAVVTGCLPVGRASAGGAVSMPASPVRLAATADIAVGDAVSASLAGQPILISQPTAGSFVAFTAICTHQGCTVAPAGSTFVCPCHGSIFSAATGQVIQGPAPAPLAEIAITVSHGEIVSG